MAYRYPVLIWQDFANFYTARLLGDEDSYFAVAGFSESKDEAIQQLKEYLNWAFENQDWRTPPDYKEPKLIEFRVEIRTQYSREKVSHQNRRTRVYPSDETFPLRVACVYWEQESRTYFCVLPLLNIEFYYYEPKTLRSLVTTYVQETLKGLTPQQLSYYLPPKSIALEEITVQSNQINISNEYEVEIPNLSSVADPLGEKHRRRQFSKAYERDKEVADLIRRLTQDKASVILLGESGVGKSSVLAEAVRQIERGLKNSVADEYGFTTKLPRHRYWLTNGARIIAGMQYLGQWEERCEHIIRELSSIDGVLCFENLLDMVKTGGESANDSIASFFLPFIQRGELRVIAEATAAELDACRRLLPGFADVFQIVSIPTFTREKALSVLNLTAAAHERNLSIRVAEGVTNLIYRLFTRFMPYQTFPGKTVSFLIELCEHAVSVPPAVAGGLHSKQVTQENVITQFIKQTGLPELFLRDEVSLEYEDALKEFERQIIGQNDACRVAANLVTTFKAGLNDPARPIGVFLFCGPTGVGKTEMAKAISRFFFGHGEGANERMIRLDMSEYSTVGSAIRLLGDASGEPSDLIRKIRQQPFAVVLLDEIEKADAAVFDVLLGLFDEGRLTDRFGRVTNFRSAVVIMTSNLGADKLEAIGFSEKVLPSYEREALSFFRPEFFNRIDALVHFGSLTQEMICEITIKELEEISKREGLKKANIKLNWTDKAVSHLAQKGFDPRYGARPLQRTIETLVIAPLSKILLEKKLKGKEVLIDINDKGQICFE
jgi:ATP-dependent Clp protease ATP-binding subunit ClpC